MTRPWRSGSAAQVILGLVAVFAFSYVAGRVARPEAGPALPPATGEATPEATRAPRASSSPASPEVPVPSSNRSAVSPPTTPVALRGPLDAARLEELGAPPAAPPSAAALRAEIATLPQRKKGERLRYDRTLRGLGIGGPGPADTRRVRKAWRAGPALRAWMAWACSEGRPEQLASAERRALLDLEAAYELRDLPDPLGPFLKLRPVPAADHRPLVSERLAPFVQEIPGFPDRLGPWGRAAIQGLAQALQESRAMREDVTNMSLGKLPRDAFPAVEFSLPYALGLTTDKILDRLVRTVQIRRAARKWFAPATRRLRGALLALGRSLVEEPESALPLALLFARLQPELRYVWLGSASAWPRRMLLGRPPAGRAGALVEAALEEARRVAQGWMRLRSRSEVVAKDAAVAEALDRVLGLPGAGPLPRAVRLHALGMRVQVARRRKQHHEAVRVLRRMLPEVVTSSRVAQVDPVLQGALLSWLELEIPLYPGARELEDIHNWIQAHPSGWRDEPSQELWTQFVELARSG